MEYIQALLFSFNSTFDSVLPLDLFHIFAVLIMVVYMVQRKRAIKKIFGVFSVFLVSMVIVYFLTNVGGIMPTVTFLFYMLLNITLMVFVTESYWKWNILNFAFAVSLVHGVETIVALLFKNSKMWFVGEYQTGVELNRLRLLYSEPAYLSFVSGLLLIIFIYNLIAIRLSSRAIIGGAICLADMLMSYGMGGMVSLIVSVFIMLMVYVINNREKMLEGSMVKYRWIIAAILMMAVFIMIIMLSPTYGFRFMTFTQGNDSSFTYTIQQPFTQFVTAMHMTNWRGIGIGQLHSVEWAEKLGIVGGIKNSFLTFMTETGAVGCFLILGIIFSLFVMCLMYGEALPIGLFVFIVLYQSVSGRFEDPINWFTYGVIVADCLRTREIQTEKKNNKHPDDNVVVGIIGAKGLGNYGGYETFVDKLTEYHANHKNIHYLVACKANGQGYMDETKLKGVVPISDNEFWYHNAHCFKLKVPQIGPGQAIIYDLMAAVYCINYFKKHKTERPILYVLTCRIGPFIGLIASMIHDLGGVYYVNPDGHEWRRSVWKPAVRRYWKFSEKLMVKHSDLVICDSKNIETYINATYDMYNPNTTYIAYGAEIEKSKLSDSDLKYQEWLSDHDLTEIGWLIVGRFVPENNFETMIREYMRCNSSKNLVIITNVNKEFLDELETRLHFNKDSRIRFVGTVYDQELLKKIRENAYGYFHGHSVGGTNPSLLEALGSTKLNLLLDVGFNRECGEDGALYWNKEEGNLANLIDRAEKLSPDEIEWYSERAKKRIKEAYSWQYIADRYESVFGKIKR